MKNVILALAVVTAISFASCKKANDLTPSNSSDNSSVSLANQKDNLLTLKKAQSSKAKVNLNGGPNDPGCIAGNECCQEVIVTANITSDLRKALASGTISTYLTDDVISILSDGDHKIANLLKHVRHGDKTMVEAFMPGTQGMKAVFLIGHSGNVSLTHYEGAIVLTS